MRVYPKLEPQVKWDGSRIVVFIDEAANLPIYRWYRNPIKLWRFNRLMKKLEKREDSFELKR